MMRFTYPQSFASGTIIFVVILMFTHFGTNDGISGVTSGISSKLTKGHLQSAMEKSEILWQKTVWQRNNVMEKNPGMGLFPASTVSNYFTYPYSAWDLVPASYSCPFEVERIGRMGDGGKWVCGMSQYEKNTKPCILYSFGIQNESSFEQEMLERTNCEIWGYDYSVKNFGNNIQDDVRPRTHFAALGVSGKSEPNRVPPFSSIQDLMSTNGHDFIDILKIDIEGSEFDALRSLKAKMDHQNDAFFPIGQMLIEIHFYGKTLDLPGFLTWWQMLEKGGFRPTWTEPNLLAVTMRNDDGMPRLSEYSLINVENPKNQLLFG